jgi:hypothetical protein
MQLLSLTPYLQRLGQHYNIDFKIDNNVGSLPVEEGSKKAIARTNLEIRTGKPGNVTRTRLDSKAVRG